MLSVCATPIGNLEDVTLRVLRELREADVILCEDTRHTRVLLGRYDIRATLLSYHEHNEAKRTAEILPRLLAGERVALVSDAGMPGISDPGARLIAAAREAGAPVTVLPGPSAVETALVASGLVGERYQFVGYLPRGEKALASLWRELAARGAEAVIDDAITEAVQTARTFVVFGKHPSHADKRKRPFALAGVLSDLALPNLASRVAFESPRRLPRTLRSLAAELPGRDVAVCRELTKRFEEVVRGTAEELAVRFAEPPKGEIVLVLGGAETVVDEAAGAEAVAELVRAGLARRQAAELVARLTGASRNALFKRSL